MVLRDDGKVEEVGGVGSTQPSQVVKETPTPKKQEVKQPDTAIPQPLPKNPDSYEYIVDVILPSLGKINGIKDTVSLRPMKTREEKFFGTMAGAAGAHKLLSKLIESCSDLTINPTDLIIDDRLHLLFKLRSLTYDNEYKLKIRCDSCNRKFVYVYDIEEASISYLEDDSVTFEVKLPLSKDVLTVKRLTGKDEISIINYEKQMERVKNTRQGGGFKEGQGTSLVDDPTYTYRMALQITAINGQEKNKNETLHYVDDMYGKDSLRLRNTVDDNALGMNLEIDMECSYCGVDNDRILPMTAEFFRPRL